MAWLPLSTGRRCTLAFPIAALALTSVGAWSSTARACSPDPCASSRRFGHIELVTPTIPTGGVLLFESFLGSGETPTAEDLALLTVEASDANGAVMGTLEPVSAFGGFLFRPDAPLSAGAMLDVVISIDNTTIDEQIDCGDDQLSVEASAVVSELAVALPELAVTPIENVYPRADDSLDALVCCDGAYPRAEPYCGAEEILWDAGICVRVWDVGWLSVGLSVDAPPTTAATANTLYRTVSADGQMGAYRHQPSGFEIWSEAPLCVRLEALSLVDGATSLGPEVCLGEALADQLGPRFVDPAEFIEVHCVGEPYVCSTVEEGGISRWDPDACTPYEGPPDTGGSDSGGSDTGGSDTGGSDTGGSDTGASATGASDTGTSDTGGDTDGGGAGQDDDASGCACAAAPTHAPRPLAALGLLLLGLRRRRR